MGKVFVNGHNKGEAIRSCSFDYDGQKTIGRFTPQEIRDWLGPETEIKSATPVLDKEASDAVARKFLFPSKNKRRQKVHWV
jgi:hypothetical protein